MDPDYELSQSDREEALKRREKDKLEQIERAKAKINEDFQRECNLRESQLIEIQNRITCLAKTLHVLRYVLVSNYYNKPETQLQLSEEDLKLVDKQQRLHPAVKRLTSDTDLSKLDFSRRKTRRTQKPIHVPSIEENITIKEETVTQVEPSRSNDDSVVAPETTTPRNRQMSKRRIIIGNISKWMPSENPEDNSTHKWMVYVRGPKDNSKINDIIKKVVFHLHPSYHPHDVIEVADHPFHLTRRGWGEFPLRCQLVFQNALNKPVDVIHQLKLDKTYSGIQTLGNETIIDLTLYDENAQDVKDAETIKQENEETCLGQNKSEVFVTEKETLCLQEINDTLERIKTEPEEVIYFDDSNDENNSLHSGTNENTACSALTDHTYSLKSLKFI